MIEPHDEKLPIGRYEEPPRMIFNLSHFQSMILFALMVSIAFGFLSRRPMRERAKYIGWSFLLFLLIGVGIGWMMYPISR
jgi:ABC-type Mn2+/Zn2+ transport system permease subunit